MQIDNLVKLLKYIWIFAFFNIFIIAGATFLIKDPVLSTPTSTTTLQVFALIFLLASQIIDVFWFKKALNDPSSDKSESGLLSVYFTGAVLSIAVLILANLIGLFFSNILNEAVRIVPVAAVSIYLLYRAKPVKEKILKNIEDLKNDQS
ncbi:hypothetical protein K2P97_12720 [bacterium]|nr:hypothetical protein [bacterium]